MLVASTMPGIDRLSRAAAREQTHPRAFTADYEPEAIVLDFMTRAARTAAMEPSTDGMVPQIPQAERRYASRNNMAGR